MTRLQEGERKVFAGDDIEALLANERWFVRPVRRGDPKMRLFCLPYAGGHGRAYCSWGERLPPNVELWPVELPGRWGRVREVPVRSMEALIDGLGPAIARYTELPYAIFGYSFGALVAFELARWMRRHAQRLPERLLLASLVPPQEIAHGRLQLHTLADDELIQQVGARYAALPAAVVQDGSMRSIVLRTLRADLACIETYEYVHEERLDVPIHVYAGDRDRAAPSHLLEGWRLQSTRDVRIEVLPGGHFFLPLSDQRFIDTLGPFLR